MGLLCRLLHGRAKAARLLRSFSSWGIRIVNIYKTIPQCIAREGENEGRRPEGGARGGSGLGGQPQRDEGGRPKGEETGHARYAPLSLAHLPLTLDSSCIMNE